MELDYIKYLKKILEHNKCLIDDYIKESLILDALSEAKLLYLEKHIECDSEKVKMIWICKTAAHKFMHLYSFYKSHELFEHNSTNITSYDNCIENELAMTEDEFVDIIKEHCNAYEIMLLTKHFYYKDTIKEIAEELSIKEMALYQRYKRLLDRLKKELPPP